MKVIAIAALTANGFIGIDRNQLSLNWTSKEDTKFYRTKTQEIGIMVMGSTTFNTFKRALPGRRLIILTSHPQDITVPGVEPTSETPEALVARLAKEGADSIAVCGGATIYRLFLERDLIDEFYLTMEPVLFTSGVPLLSDGIQRKLHLLEMTHLNENSLLFHYAVKK